MPNARTRRRNRRFKRRQTRAYLRNRGSKSQALQISRLATKVNRLDYKLAKRGNYFTYYNAGRQNIPAVISPTSLAGYGFNIFRLSPNTTTWTPALNQPTDPQKLDDEWRLRKTRTQMRIDIGNETDSPIFFNVFVVKVKKNMRDMIYANYGNDLSGFFNPQIAGTPLPTDSNYNPFACYSSGLTNLNTKIFSIKKSWKFHLGQVGYGSSQPAVRNIRDTVRDLYFTQSYGGKKGLKLARGTGEVIDGLDTANKTVNRSAWTFCLIISNNGANDLGLPEVRFTNLHTISTGD